LETGTNKVGIQVSVAILSFPHFIQRWKVLDNWWIGGREIVERPRPDFQGKEKDISFVYCSI